MEPLKNQFNHTFTAELVSRLSKVDKTFNSQTFVEYSTHASDWEALELKERMMRYSVAIDKSLGGSFKSKAASVCEVSSNFSGLQGMVFPGFIELFGIAHESTSLKALKYLTQYSTSEFAIRPFILNNHALVSTEIFTWSMDSNYHVRRLSSEGVRPRLPWAQQLTHLIEDPSPILPILENLKNDGELYVKKSVANNLNDITKDHPELVLSMLKNWDLDNPHTLWIAKHALRSLLKAGDRTALLLFGFKEPRGIECELCLRDETFKTNERYFADLAIRNLKQTQKLRVEYLIHYPRLSGKYYDKVFQVKEGEFASEREYTFTLKIDLENKSTRKVYPGDYKISVKVNGSVLAQLPFKVN